MAPGAKAMAFKVKAVASEVKAVAFKVKAVAPGAKAVAFKVKAMASGAKAKQPIGCSNLSVAADQVWSFAMRP
jgi:hypothetical protein